MDWESQLASILRLTNANLQKEFLENPLESEVLMLPHEGPATATDPSLPPPPPPRAKPLDLPANLNVNEIIDQIQFSLKQELENRAALLERQVNGLYQSTQINSQEIDRLRSDMTGATRSLRSLDHSHQKFQHELGVQQTMSYHIQGLHGKDESWRMQNETQMLELRQIVNNLREQMNSLVVAVQEKSTRNELLTYLKAVVDPIKADLTTNLQHHSQLISSATQSISNGCIVTEDLASRINALEHHFRQPSSSLHSSEGTENREKDTQQQQQQPQVNFSLDTINQQVDTRVQASVQEKMQEITKQLYKIDKEKSDEHAAKMKKMEERIRELNDSLEKEIKDRKVHVEKVENKLQSTSDFISQVTQETTTTIRAKTTTLQQQLDHLDQRSLQTFKQIISESDHSIRDLEKRLINLEHELEEVRHLTEQNQQRFPLTPASSAAAFYASQFANSPGSASFSYPFLHPISIHSPTVAQPTSQQSQPPPVQQDAKLSEQASISTSSPQIHEQPLASESRTKSPVDPSPEIAIAATKSQEDSVPTPVPEEQALIAAESSNKNPLPPVPAATKAAERTAELVGQIQDSPNQSTSTPAHKERASVQTPSKALEKSILMKDSDIQAQGKTTKINSLAQKKTSSSPPQGTSLPSKLFPAKPSTPAPIQPPRPKDPPPASLVRPKESIKTCELCEKPIEVPKFADHQKSCPERKMNCQFCDEKVRTREMSVHEINCLNRLEHCRHCNQLIQFKQLIDHEATCQNQLKQCPHCLKRIKLSEMEQHIETCACRLVKCPNECGGKFLNQSLARHMSNSCPLRSSSKTATKEKKDTNIHATAEECKYCDEMIELDKLERHQATCDWKPQRCQFCNMVIILRDLQRHEQSCKEQLKSCSHCKERFKPQNLATHLTNCSKRPIKCIRCGKQFPAETIVNHSRNCKEIPKQFPSSVPRPPPPPPGSPSSRKRSNSTSVIAIPPTPAKSSPAPAVSLRRHSALAQLSMNPEKTEEEEEEEDEGMTLTAVVAEWDVENVSLWLREDVGVPNVIDAFEKARINGLKLLELTEDQLIRQLNVRDRWQRKRILEAIDAIKLDDEDDDDYDDEEDEED